jgi:hypothetical protein
VTERRSKYNAIRCEIDGIKFDSKAEAQRYQELFILVRAFKIDELKIHPHYEIVPKDEHGRALYYEADFEYITIAPIPCRVVEDVKGVKTAVYKLKRRLFLARYPEYTFQEIT